jgi:hypothetical protein
MQTCMSGDPIPPEAAATPSVSDGDVANESTACRSKRLH